MTNQISYDRAGTSTDPAELAQYVIEGIVNNNEIHGAKTSDWGDSYDAIDVYLSHNPNLSPDVLNDVSHIVQKWIDSNKSQE